MAVATSACEEAGGAGERRPEGAAPGPRRGGRPCFAGRRLPAFAMCSG